MNKNIHYSTELISFIGIEKWCELVKLARIIEDKLDPIDNQKE